ncbi:MAG: flagellin [Alphaproteobacteria bacterium]
MISGVSNLSILSQATRSLNTGQENMADLTQQLASGRKTSDITDYSVFDARTLLSSRDLQDKSTAYIAAIHSVSPRLSVYQSTLSSLTTLTTNIQSLINNTQNATAAQEQGLPAQISAAIDQVEYYLNQKVGDRYIYSGTRYTQKPIGDIAALPTPPAETFPAVSGTLPPYDGAAPGTDAKAYAQDKVMIDDNLQLNYGIPSTSLGIQNMIQGLRFALSATKDSANYDTYMAQAQSYLGTAVNGLRNLEAQTAGNQKILAQAEADQKSTINLLQTRIGNIQNVDLNEVSVKINAYQTQLNASYAATAKLINMSILNYL